MKTGHAPKAEENHSNELDLQIFRISLFLSFSFFLRNLKSTNVYSKLKWVQLQLKSAWGKMKLEIQ